ncbi:hypothetical protein [Halobacteriovorax sp. RT-2-4]|uniref:hypothetical protein n=1 Tax=unclassified Halobacteriovorax TaxID=2639665 RepID=UPI00399BC069
MKKVFLSLMMLSQASIFAYGIGQSTMPMLSGSKQIATELTGITSDKGGMGMQVRYTQKLDEKLIVDGGIGISGGERSQRLFVGADYEIYPDYMQQPRVSVKGILERSTEFDQGITKISMAPTITKGFSFWGKEAYPYASLPVGLSLNGDTKTYETTISLNTGINGQLPIEGFKHLNGTMEVQVGLKDSFTAFLAGVSFPL